MNQTTHQQPVSKPRGKVLPRTDVLETPEALILIADVPGADRDSIELLSSKDVLTLKARSVDQAPEGWQPVGAGFECPDYERRFRIRADIDREAMTASLSNGRLRVVLQKRHPRSNRIEVRAGS